VGGGVSLQLVFRVGVRESEVINERFYSNICEKKRRGVFRVEKISGLVNENV